MRERKTGAGSRRVTLQQIARQVGLSTFAVSRSLSGKDGVSEETRRLVGQVAARLGYLRPAPVRSGDIGLVLHDLDNVNGELRMQIQRGVQHEASRLNKPIRSQWTHSLEHIVELARGCAGLLLVGPHDRAATAAVQAIGIPVVRLGWVDPLEQVDQVVHTDREGGEAVAQYLIDLGHRCIAFVHGAGGFRGRRERYHGMREIAERHPDVVLHQMFFEEQGGFVDAFRRLRQAGDDPTAFFCANDGLALTVMSELLGLGHRIPEDVSVVGFGDFSAAIQISPQLTTVRVDGGEMGAAALRLLLERIAGRRADAPSQRVLIASRIIERRSAGPRRLRGS